MNNSLCMIIPCYNEEDTLPKSTITIEKKLQDLINKNKISKNSKMMLVDDGSSDNTWQIITKLHEQNPQFIGIKLSKNQGHQNALLAGLLTAKENFDLTISMDADLQDDINAVDAMIEHFYNGCEIVYGIRNNRENDSFFKKITANIFYKLMNALGAQTINNHADFRLMSKKAINALKQFEEVNLFLRGIIPLIGYKTAQVFYKRQKRTTGVSKYTLKKMIYFAIDGITSCSTKLISILFFCGIISLIFSVLSLILLTITHTELISTLTLFSIWLVGGLNLIAMSIIGEFVGKTYMETKKRPKFFIEKIID